MINRKGKNIVSIYRKGRPVISVYRKGLPVYTSEVNLIVGPDDFTNVAWDTSSLTVLSNATNAPNGSLTADKLTSNTSDSFADQFVSVAPNTSYRFSVYLRSDVNTTLGIYVTNDAREIILLGLTCNVNTTWQKFEISGNIGARSTVAFFVGGAGSFTTSEYVYAANAKAVSI